MERYIGKMLDNRYEILEVIGTGGMAVVFKAKCHRLNRLVAIKMLKKNLSEDAEFRRRFHDESQAVAMLSHPNIMAVYDVSRGGDMDYIVMELIDGITLKQYMERRGRLNWPEALHFITQIMKGLSHAHSRGIVHRDIKPQNIMVLRDGTVKVTDFGIACLAGGKQSVGEAIGSVHYISPEQAKGDYTDNRSDIYSAGVVLYEMLTSRLPFDGSDPVSVAIQHFSVTPKSPRELNPDVPEALEQICLKAMAPDRNKRYATADEMLADLEEFRKDPTVSFDYSVEDLAGSEDQIDEPTRYIPNVAVARNKQNHVSEPVDQDDDEEEDGRRRFGWLKILALILLLAGAGYFAVTQLYNSIMGTFSQGEVLEYTVPRVIGMTIQEASASPNVKDTFTIKSVGEEYNSQYEAGQIIRQTPEENTIKRSNLVIEVVVSLGARSGDMPYLIGIDLRTARLRLGQDEYGKLGLEVVEGEAEYSDTIEEGKVLRTIPAEGAALSEGDTVTLIPSKGPEIKYVQMPPCLTLSVERVQQMMDAAGLVAVFEPVNSSKPEGEVLSQSVDVNEKVPEGSTVTFTYSDGEKLIEKDYQYNISGGTADVYVEAYLDDTLILSTELPGNYGQLDIKLNQKAGTYTLRIYVDYALVRQEELTFSE